MDTTNRENRLRWYYMNYAILRATKKYTDSDVARLTGIAVQTFYRWKKGGAMPAAEGMAKICAALDCKINEIIN